MRVKIALVCQDCKRKNYYSMKNKDKKEKLELKKYCKFCRKHTAHRESKV